jgi:F0F1-type ATP synthase membrane subunit b/b'
VNRAKLKLTKLITTTSRVSVRNIIESAREGAKEIASEIKSVTRRFVLPRFGSRKPTPR